VRITTIESVTPQCSLCGSENLEKGFSIEKRLPSYKQYQVTVCQNCGNVQVDLNGVVEND
jgi:hypothetical protein